jgi:hypothetical protein
MLDGEQEGAQAAFYTTPWRATHSVLDNGEKQEEIYLSFEFISKTLVRLQRLQTAKGIW